MKYNEDKRDLITEMQKYLQNLSRWSQRRSGALPDEPSTEAIDMYMTALGNAKLIGGRKNKSRKNKRRNRKSRRY